MFTNLLGPVLDKMSNHYQLNFLIWSIADGTSNQEMFTFDFRNT